MKQELLDIKKEGWKRPVIEILSISKLSNYSIVSNKLIEELLYLYIIFIFIPEG